MAPKEIFLLQAQLSQCQRSPPLLFSEGDTEFLNWGEHVMCKNNSSTIPQGPGRVDGIPPTPHAPGQSLIPQGADKRLTEAILSSYDDPAVPAALSCSSQPCFPLHFPFINSCLAVLLISAAWNNVTFPTTLLFYLQSTPPPAAAFLPPPPAWKAIIHFFILFRLYISDSTNNLFTNHARKKIKKFPQKTTRKFFF